MYITFLVTEDSRPNTLCHMSNESKQDDKFSSITLMKTYH